MVRCDDCTTTFEDSIEPTSLVDVRLNRAGYADPIAALLIV